MKDRIVTIRKNLNLNQQEFADELGISKSNVASYEIGRRNPSDAVISLICNRFDISENWLRTGEGDPKAPITKEAEIAKIAKQMLKAPEGDFRTELIKSIAIMPEEDIQRVLDYSKFLANLAASCENKEKNDSEENKENK